MQRGPVGRGLAARGPFTVGSRVVMGDQRTERSKFGGQRSTAGSALREGKRRAFESRDDLRRLNLSSSTRGLNGRDERQDDGDAESGKTEVLHVACPTR